jgi:hypothetical protein
MDVYEHIRDYPTLYMDTLKKKEQCFYWKKIVSFPLFLVQGIVILVGRSDIFQFYDFLYNKYGGIFEGWQSWWYG